MTPQFRAAITTYGPRYARDLGLTQLQVAGMFGNWGVESDQYRALQEYKPVVAGSRGGWGPPQWTGPRRVAFERWADAAGYRRDDPEAFYGFTVIELRGAEARALRGLKAMTTLDSATEVFMRLYERPGVPHLERRKALALEALHELEAVMAPAVATVSAPRVEAVVAPAAPAKLPWWQRLIGRKAAPVERPGLKPNGSVALWDVQKALRDRNYYTKGFLDGLDGGLTQGAVAQARKDNGLGDGGIDAAFLAALSTMPKRPVSADRAAVTIAKAAEHAPELFRPPAWLASIGAGALGLGGASGTGLLDTVNTAAGKVNDVAGGVQTAFGFIASGVGFVVEHKTLFFVGLGLVLLFKAVSYALDAWIKVRQAFF